MATVHSADAWRFVLSAYAERLEALAADAADCCTACGKCFKVCPTAREVGLGAGDAVQRVGELLALTRTAEPPADGLQKWLAPAAGSPPSRPPPPPAPTSTPSS